MRYTLALKTAELELRRVVQLDAEARARYDVKPRSVSLGVEVPEGRVRDAEYQAAIRVVVRPPQLTTPGLRRRGPRAGCAARRGPPGPGVAFNRDHYSEAGGRPCRKRGRRLGRRPGTRPMLRPLPLPLRPFREPERRQDGERVDSSARLPLSPVPGHAVPDASRAALSLS